MKKFILIISLLLAAVGLICLYLLAWDLPISQKIVQNRQDDFEKPIRPTVPNRSGNTAIELQSDASHLQAGGRSWTLVFEDFESSTLSLRAIIAADLRTVFGKLAHHKIHKFTGSRVFVVNGKTIRPIEQVDFSMNENYTPLSKIMGHFGYLVEKPGKDSALLVPKKVQIAFLEHANLATKHRHKITLLKEFLRLLEENPELLLKQESDVFLPTFSHTKEDLTIFARRFRVSHIEQPTTLDFFESEEFPGFCVEVRAHVMLGDEPTSNGLLLCYNEGHWKIVL